MDFAQRHQAAMDAIRKDFDENEDEVDGLFGLMKHNNSEDKNVNGNWFHRTILNCGALQFPSSTEELFAITKVRHLNFFESIIQANVRKEAEDTLAAFEFWTDKKVKNLFEEEINKFLWSDLSSDMDTDME